MYGSSTIAAAGTTAAREGRRKRLWKGQVNGFRHAGHVLWVSLRIARRQLKQRNDSDVSQGTGEPERAHETPPRHGRAGRPLPVSPTLPPPTRNKQTTARRSEHSLQRLRISRCSPTGNLHHTKRHCSADTMTVCEHATKHVPSTIASYICSLRTFHTTNRTCRVITYTLSLH